MEYYSSIRDNCASDELEMTGCLELNSVDVLEKKKESNQNDFRYSRAKFEKRVKPVESETG